MAVEEEEIEGDDDIDIDQIKDKQIVVPGEVLSEDLENFNPGRGTIRKDDKIVSVYVGLKVIRKNFINVIPLRGIYNPKPGDKVIGIVIDKNPVKWKLDINAKYFGILKPSNTLKNQKTRRPRGEQPSTEDLDVGDVLIVKIIQADRLHHPELTTVGKFLGKRHSGRIIEIPPPKIPRIIGRKGSMINLLKKMTNCNIFVTQNGRIWIQGEDIEHECLLIDTIYKIENEAHTSGLTDRIKEFIMTEKSKRGIDQ
jgi:exosome complex component RRP4